MTLFSGKSAHCAKQCSLNVEYTEITNMKKQESTFSTAPHCAKQYSVQKTESTN